MGLSALNRYSFDVNGYVVLDDVLETRQVNRLRAAVDAHVVTSPGRTVDEQRFYGDSGLLGLDQEFRDLMDHPVVLGVLGDLIGPYVRLDHTYGIMMAPGTSGLGLHGPYWPFDAAQFYAHRGGRMWNGLLVFSWALTTAAPGEGGFGCIPGSHRAAEQVPPGADVLVVEVSQRAGSLLVFTEALAHCTIPWNGPENRLNLLYKYSPGNSSWAPTSAATAEVFELLTERQRRLVEPPYVGGRRKSID